MYRLKVISNFSAAHNLRDYKGKCEALHGHNYKVEVVLEGSMLDNNGLLIDFKDIKESLKKVIDKLDHKYLNELSYFIEINPSSENLAKYIYSELQNIYCDKMCSVTIWETNGSAATYCENIVVEKYY
jgi:6-pyruvoyltetrahydropterin/6-carboxytetrahydropterin synthase